MTFAKRSVWWGLSLRRTAWPRELVVALGVAASCLFVSYLVAHGHVRSAIVVAMLPLVSWILLRPRLATILLAISIPFPVSLLGAGATLNVAGSDVLLALTFAVLVMEAMVRGRKGNLTALKPLVLPFAPYLAWMAILAASHLSVTSFVQSGQRLELFLFPAVVGAAIAARGLEQPLLKAYLLTATIFAALYPIFSNEAGGLGAQKNPAGQYIANALLLLIAVKSLRQRFALAAPILLLGLLWTQSRGAILSVVVGLFVLLLMHPGRDRLRFLALMVPISLTAAGAFALLPQAAQDRNTSFETGTGSRAAYSLKIRETFREEAWAIVHADPVFGTGIGQYVQGVNGIRPTTTDPHQVLLFQAAEGGYPLAGAFLILILGSGLVIAWRGRDTLLGPAAAALLIATFGHGLVDVYWVRGTPVLSWILVGIVLGQIVKARAAPEAGSAVANVTASSASKSAAFAMSNRGRE